MKYPSIIAFVAMGCLAQACMPAEQLIGPSTTSANQAQRPPTPTPTPTTSSAVPATSAPAQLEPATADALPPEQDIAPTGTLPDLRASVGTRSSEAPVPFEKLDRSMTPEDVGAIIPGAEKVSKHGISKVKVTDVPGVAAYKFSFHDGKLYSATIIYQAKYADQAFVDYFFKAVENKCGPMKAEARAKQLVTYARTDGSVIQAMKFVDHFELSYTPPRP